VKHGFTNSNRENRFMSRKRKPSYLLHKPTGQARVRINGTDHYLGVYGTPESRDRYEICSAMGGGVARNGDTSRPCRFRLAIAVLPRKVEWTSHHPTYTTRKDAVHRTLTVEENDSTA